VSGWRLRRRVELPQGSVAFDVLGQGPPVVLVHGTPTWSYLWRKVVPALEGDHSVYVFDLLGYGDSPAGPSADISVAAQARLLVELLDRWGLEEPAVAGHDIGGAVVLRTHLLHRRRFRRIALVDAVILAPWITATTRHMQAHLAAYQTMPVHIYEQIVAAHLRTAAFGALDEEAFSAYLRPWRGERGRAAYFQKVAQFDEDHTAEFEPLLAGLGAPLLLLWGEQDAWLSPELGRRLLDRIPGAELTVIPGAGHLSMEDAPEAVAAALAKFFAAGPG
jgi:pimeloyl-ACP methyl ester carboxylesterase